MTVLVAGASGTTGSLVVSQLVEAGVPVRAMTRSADKAADLGGPGVDVAVASFDDREALAAAFAGVSAAYVVTPSSPEMAHTERAFAEAAADAGAHVVKLSVFGAAPDVAVRLAVPHAEAEAAIAATGASWTFVQPNGFMQNDLAWAAQLPTGTIAGPAMDAAWSIVDARDIAAVAVAALTDPTTYTGRRIVVTGPAARTPRERIDSLGALLGRDLTAVDVPIAAFKAQLLGYGVDAWTVDGLGELYAMYEAGLAADVSPDAPGVLGRQVRTWEEFAADHAASFAG